MSISWDFSLTQASAIGERCGLTLADVNSLKPVFTKMREQLYQKHIEKEILIWHLPYDDQMLDTVANYGERCRTQFENFVVLGIGGSALGTIALHQSLNHQQFNLLPPEVRRAPRFFCPDNIDPDTFGGVIDIIDPQTTIFNVVSKSGSTTETIAQFMVIVDLVKKQCGKGWREHIVITTDPEKGFLKEFASQERIVTFEVPPKVGGRFSLFTPVCLFPAAVLGIDIFGLSKGARKVRDICLNEDFDHNLPAKLAGLLYLFQSLRNLPIHIFFAYSNRLYAIADWFRQLWAESLGKRYSITGDQIFTGPTPVKALGATDQHSQVQLYTEGPYDKAFLFIGSRTPGRKFPLPTFHRSSPETDYLQGADMGDLLNMERLGTIFALAQAGRPVISCELDLIDPPHIGALLLLLETTTLYAGGFYNVNPLDQPGVEAGKIATYALMGRQGFGREREIIRDFFKRHTQQTEVIAI